MMRFSSVSLYKPGSNVYI